MLARFEDELPVPPEVEDRVVARVLALRAERNISESDDLTEEQVYAAIREVYEARADAQDARDARTPPAGAAPAPAASGPVLPALVAAGLGQRSERPHRPPHLTRTATLTGLADGPPLPPASRSPRPAPAAPLPPASRSPQPAPAPPVASTRHPQPPPPVPPPRPRPAAPPPTETSAARPEDFDDPDEATRVGKLPTAADLAPAGPSAARPEEFDDPDEETRFMERPEPAAPAAKRDQPTLRSMTSVAPPTPRPAPSVDVLPANRLTTGARASLHEAGDGRP
jgi:hypothetical protein